MPQVSEKTYGQYRDLVVSLAERIADDGRPYSRNRIVRESGLSAYWVDKICKAEGIKFDRSTPGLQAMRSALEASNREARLRVSQQVLKELESVFRRMHEPQVVVGWYMGDAIEHELKQPSPADLKNYATTIGILIDKHIVLERFGSEGGEVDASLEKVQIATEVARIVKANPDMSVEDVINEVVNR